MRVEAAGRFAVEDDFVVMKPSSGEAPTRYRITGVGRSADGRGTFLLLGVLRENVPALSAGSRMSRAGDLYVGAQ